MSTYHPVEPTRRRRWRRRLRRVPWRGLLWLGGTAGVTGWWAARAPVGWAAMVLVATAYALLLGAALTQPWRRTP